MSDSSAKRQRTSSKDAKDDDAMNTLFDILSGVPGLIKLIQQFLDVKDSAVFIQVLKGGLFKQIVKQIPKNEEKPSSLEVVEKTLDIFLANCKQLYELIERYREEFPHGTAWRNQIPTPIVCACEHGRMNDVQSFVNLHPFYKYITNRDVNGHRDDMTLKEMVNQLGTDSRGSGERTPLMAAARNGHFQVVEYLIEQCEADPTIEDSDGWNALHWAAGWNRTSTELIELLLTHMPLTSINKKDCDGDTPLDYAYGNNDSPIRQEIITLLRSNGGISNVYDENGNYIESDDEEDADDVDMNEEVNQLLKF